MVGFHVPENLFVNGLPHCWEDLGKGCGKGFECQAKGIVAFVAFAEKLLGYLSGGYLGVQE